MTSILQFFAAHIVMQITPGPITFAAGSRASFQGFGRTLPLLAGICVGRVVLIGLLVFGAFHLAASLSSPAANVGGAVVLCAMAWRISAARSTSASSKTISGAWPPSSMMRRLTVGAH